MTSSPCGTCGVCCKVPPIAELEKPQETWCRHYAKGAGCSVYSDRPMPCREFVCAWLRNVTDGLIPPNDIGLRPDRSKVFCREFSRDGRMVLRLHAYDPLHPKALDAPMVQSLIRRAYEAGYVVEAASRSQTVTYDKTLPG